MSQVIKFAGGGQVEIEPEAGSAGLTRVTLTGARRPKISIVQVTKDEAFEFAKTLKQESDQPAQNFAASEVAEGTAALIADATAEGPDQATAPVAQADGEPAA